MSRKARRVAAWCLYDFANSAFTTVIVTTVFSVYFVKTVVPEGPVAGELLWSLATSFSLLVTAILSPVLGALADARAQKRTFLIASSLACIVPTALLSTVSGGDVGRALALFIVANIGFELGYVFYNSFLPEIAPAERAGRVSGLGWGIGYVGGMFSLAVAMLPLRFLLPHSPSPAQLEAGSRICFLLVAAHFALFAMPAFVLLRDRQAGERREAVDLREPLRRVAGTIRHLRRHAEAFKFILASLVYNDGVVTIFLFAGIYMSRGLRFSEAEIVLAVLLINIPAAAGSIGFGFVGDRIGGKRTVLITLALLLATVAAMAASAPGDGASDPQLARARAWFWVLAMIAGFGIGANQSASRALMSVLIPPGKQAEFFGFFIFSGKLASVLSPLAYGTVVQLTGSSRLAILSVVVFLAAGAALLGWVNEEEGRRQARGELPH